MLTDAWAPVVQSLLWIVAASVLLFLGRQRASGLLDAVVHRVVNGAPIGLGPLKLGSIPRNLPARNEGAATAEGRAGAPPEASLQQQLEAKRYQGTLADEYYLVHEAHVLRPRTPSSPGLFRLHVWLEADTPALLSKVRRVTYRLHDTFPSHVLATEAGATKFDLWLQCIGEFAVVAVVEGPDGGPLWITRYLDLPGRPPE